MVQGRVQKGINVGLFILELAESNEHEFFNVVHVMVSFNTDVHLFALEMDTHMS